MSEKSEADLLLDKASEAICEAIKHLHKFTDITGNTESGNYTVEYIANVAKCEARLIKSLGCLGYNEKVFDRWRE